MPKTRIIKRIKVNGCVEFAIQQKHYLLRWMWVDASYNKFIWEQDSFKTYEQAKKALCYFDGSKPKVEVVSEH